jgi:hypothetical protein
LPAHSDPLASALHHPAPVTSLSSDHPMLELLDRCRHKVIFDHGWYPLFTDSSVVLHIDRLSWSEFSCFDRTLSTAGPRQPRLWCLDMSHSRLPAP